MVVELAFAASVSKSSKAFHNTVSLLLVHINLNRLPSIFNIITVIIMVGALVYWLHVERTSVPLCSRYCSFTVI